VTELHSAVQTPFVSVDPRPTPASIASGADSAGAGLPPWLQASPAGVERSALLSVFAKLITLLVLVTFFAWFGETPDAANAAPDGASPQAPQSEPNTQAPRPLTLSLRE
jgi:hypothetical protein